MRSATLYKTLAVLLVLIAAALAANHAGALPALQVQTAVRIPAGVLAGLLIGIVAALTGFAGGELLISTSVLLFGIDITIAGVRWRPRRPHPGRAAGQRGAPPEAVAQAYAAVVASQVRLITAVLADIEEMEQLVGKGFGRHPEAEIYLSHRDSAPSSAPDCWESSATHPSGMPTRKPQKNYAETSPITCASGEKKVVLPDMHATDASATPSISGPSAPPSANPAPAPTTRRYGSGRLATTSPYTNSPTASSASCTAALYDEQTAWAHHLIAPA